jgi:hypothetical protein
MTDDSLCERAVDERVKSADAHNRRVEKPKRESKAKPHHMVMDLEPNLGVALD